MDVRSRRQLLAGFGALFGLARVARAEDPRPASPDGDYLEYLGGEDLEPEIAQYLAKPDAAGKQDAKPAPNRGSSRS